MSSLGLKMRSAVIWNAGFNVFRDFVQIECEGCGLIECLERKNECLNRITAAQVLAACEQILKTTKTETLKH